MRKPLMPKATAVWLLEKTSLTFKQIGEFCGLHPLEVQAIADGEVASGVRARNPILEGDLTAEEIALGEGNESHSLKIKDNPIYELAEPKKRRGAKYTPLFKRQNKPDAILFLLRSHPELSDAQIIRLVGTTKNTIASVRDKTHWNYQNMKPADPVILGLCTQSNLNAALEEAEKRNPKAPQEEIMPSGALHADASEFTNVFEALSSQKHWDEEEEDRN